MKSVHRLIREYIPITRRSVKVAEGLQPVVLLLRHDVGLFDPVPSCERSRAVLVERQRRVLVRGGGVAVGIEEVAVYLCQPVEDPANFCRGTWRGTRKMNRLSRLTRPVAPDEFACK